MRLELFLKNKMTEEEENAFLNELQSNPDLIQRSQTMVASIKKMKELKFEYGQRIVSRIECMQERDFRTEAKLPQKARIISRHTLVRMSIAACFIGIIIFCGYRYHTYNETIVLNESIALGNRYYAEIPTEMIVRDADDVSKQLTQLFNNVKNSEDLDNTILSLEDKFNVALSEDYNDYTNYINDIGWNLAIAYLKDGNRNVATTTLELLISHSENDIVIEKSKKLIKEVEQL